MSANPNDDQRLPAAPQVANEETSAKLESKVEQLQHQDQERQVRARAEAAGLPYVDLSGFPISPQTIGAIDEDQARSLGIIAFLRDSGELRLGAVNPHNPQAVALAKELATREACAVTVYAISERSFQKALAVYARLPKVAPHEGGVTIKPDELAKFSEQLHDFHDLEQRASQVPTTSVLSLILAGGLRANASDIHLETSEAGVTVRYRLDGTLHHVATLPRGVWSSLISRIKLLAKLKLNIVAEAQDGSFSIYLPSDRLEVRVSTVPTAFGESVVLRLLRSVNTGLSFEDLGLRGRAYAELLREVRRPNGMVLTTGPTGSGKTTTLYAILNLLNRPEVKIATLEDPIEYQLPGINQSEINVEVNYTFARGLRGILRQDPDIIMVGEIRDAETAEVAINASLTGHLVLSTLHTNDAAGALPRLLALGVKPFLLAPAINAVVGQRLVRRICERCRQPVELDVETMGRVVTILKAIPVESGAALTPDELDRLTFYRGVGCDACQRIGYRGRTGIYEVLSLNKDVEQVILTGQLSEYQVREVATKGGMLTMVQDGLLKARDGVTTVEEVFKVAE